MRRETHKVIHAISGTSKLKKGVIDHVTDSL